MRCYTCYNLFVPPRNSISYHHNVISPSKTCFLLPHIHIALTSPHLQYVCHHWLISFERQVLAGTKDATNVEATPEDFTATRKHKISMYAFKNSCLAFAVI